MFLHVMSVPDIVLRVRRQIPEGCTPCPETSSAYGYHVSTGHLVAGPPADSPTCHVSTGVSIAGP
eukprot:2968711-Rhodomonas_salina.2